MNIEDLAFEQLDINGVRTLVDWAREEGWNPGPHDADVFYATDPHGFYGYFYNGAMIAGGAIVSYGGAFGFMGLFIVKLEYRSAGIGRKLWHQRRDTLLKRLNKGAAIGMDGVVAMQPFYEQGGFTIAFRDERYELTGKAYDVDEHISPIQEADKSKIYAYDSTCFGVERTQFMNAWLNIPDANTFLYEEDGTLRGYAVLRKADKGYKIGPLFADDHNTACKLYEACLNAANGEQVYLDIPVNNPAAVQLVKDYNATYVFECARMYHGTPPPVYIEKVFGITSFELG